MRIKNKNIIININNTLDNPAMDIALKNIEEEVCAVENPIGCDKFILDSKFKSNVVKPIKESFMNNLQKSGWILEDRLDVWVTPTKPDPIDATFPYEN